MVTLHDGLVPCCTQYHGCEPANHRLDEDGGGARSYATTLTPCSYNTLAQYPVPAPTSTTPLGEELAIACSAWSFGIEKPYVLMVEARSFPSGPRSPAVHPYASASGFPTRGTKGERLASGGDDNDLGSQSPLSLATAVSQQVQTNAGVHGLVLWRPSPLGRLVAAVRGDPSTRALVTSRLRHRLPMPLL